MIPFIQNWSHGRYGFSRVTVTILLMIIAFIAGNLPLLWIMESRKVNSIPALNDILGFEGLLMLQVLPFLTVLGTLFFLIPKVHASTWKHWLHAREKLDFRRILDGFMLWSIILLFFFGVDLGLNPNSFEWNFEAWPFIKALLLLGVLLPIQVLVEELIFRSFALQGFMAASRSAIVSIVFSACLFGAMHAGNPEVQEHGPLLLVVYALMGVFLSVITFLDQGIELAFGFHLANNLINAVLVTSNDLVFQVPAIFRTKALTMDTSSSLMLLVGLALFFTIAHRRYRWQTIAMFKKYR